MKRVGTFLIVVALIAGMGGCACDPVGGSLSAANTELDEVKKASAAFHSENGHWPETSEELLDHWLFGPPRARYHFCSTYGWVIEADSEGVDSTWPDTIAFKPGESGEDGYHGEWVRADEL